jgi:hypothetical protein
MGNEYCACLHGTEDLKDSYCILKYSRDPEESSCLAVERSSFIAGTGEIEYSAKDAKKCPFFTLDSFIADDYK